MVLKLLLTLSTFLPSSLILHYFNAYVELFKSPIGIRSDKSVLLQVFWRDALEVTMLVKLQTLEVVVVTLLLRRAE